MESINPKISVIVPVYNVENYLRRCVDSILAQTFTDFELLLIDDGSKDKSGEICDEYARKDNRVKVFHKENGGVSTARNKGLLEVKGKWICFCDADDKLCSHETFDLPFSYIEKNSVDIIEFPYSRNNVIKIQQESLIKSHLNVCKYYTNHFHNELWGRIYSKELIASIRFDEHLKIGEDVVFFLSLFNNIQNIYISNKGGYLYSRNEDSVMIKTGSKKEKEQIEKYLASIENLQINLDSIIGFYYNTASYIWSERERFVINELNFINYFTIHKILKSNLKISSKVRFVILRYLFLYLYK